jgi:excisionase family DNA binding protein
MAFSTRRSAPGIRLGGAEVVTIAQTAALLGVSKMTVYRLVHAEVLPATRIGSSFWIDRTDLVAYMCAHNRAPL